MRESVPLARANGARRKPDERPRHETNARSA